MAWHKGTWWPLYVKEWYTPKASAHMFDPYSFCLVVAGLLLHLLWGTDSLDTWVIGFAAAVALELVWELIGNTPLVLKRIRNNNGACGEYIGRHAFPFKHFIHSLIFHLKVTPSKTSWETLFPAPWAMCWAHCLRPLSSGGSASSGLWLLRYKL